MNRITHFLLLLICIPFQIPYAASQELSSLNVVVEDPQGRTIPDARVVLTSKAGGERIVGNTNDSGSYLFSGLSVGSYQLKALAPGFDESVLDVNVGSQPESQVRIRLKLAAVNEELTVTAQSDVVAPEANADAFQVDQDLLKSLPAMDSNPLAAASLFLDPSASGVEGPQLIVDGAEVSELDVPASSIKTVSVNKNPYSPEFSRPGKGRIEVKTRGGDEKRIHKHIVFTARDSEFDARNGFAVARPPMQRYFTEADVNGPLPDNKGTYYLGGEYLKDNDSSIVRALTPSGLVATNVPSEVRTPRMLGRIDYRLSPMQTLSVSYNRTHSTLFGQGIGAFDLPERAYNDAEHDDVVRIGETAILSSHATNQLNFAWKRRISDIRSITDQPATIVLGAFNGGGGQLNKFVQQDEYEAQDFVDWIRGKHNIRFGATVRHRGIHFTDASNFGGTFTYSSLVDYTEGDPITYSQNSGIPSASFNQVEYNYFFTDEIRLRPTLSLMLGLRHELQSNLRDYNNLAPRVGISWNPGGGSTVLRVGGGVFYQKQPWSMTQQALLLDGYHVIRFVLEDPEEVFKGTQVPETPPSITRIAPDIRSPYSTQVSATLEQKLASKTFLSVDFTGLRGVKLYRMRDINAPLPATEMRPDPRYLMIDQFEASGSSSAYSLSTTFRTSMLNRIQLVSQYTFGRSIDDTSGMNSLPADNYNLRAERALSDFDRRHRFNAAGILRLPHELMIGAMVTLASPLPYNITTGHDNNEDGVAIDRPPFMGRNTGRGPREENVDIRVSRRFRIQKWAERNQKVPYVEIRMDAFNVFNRLNPVNYIGTLTSPLYGMANSAYPARRIQLSMKLSF